MAGKILDAARSAASAGLLRIGMTYEEQGNINSAIRTYLKIVASYPDSEEAKIAVEKVTLIADDLENKGYFNWAMSLYDRLEEASA